MGQDWPMLRAGEYLDTWNAQESLREGSPWLKRLEGCWPASEPHSSLLTGSPWTGGVRAQTLV